MREKTPHGRPPCGGFYNSLRFKLIYRKLVPAIQPKNIAAMQKMLLDDHGGGKRRQSMQTLMNDQPEPPCGRVEHNRAEYHGAERHGPKQHGPKQYGPRKTICLD
jgi:hypothetical protein